MVNCFGFLILRATCSRCERTPFSEIRMALDKSRRVMDRSSSSAMIFCRDVIGLSAVKNRDQGTENREGVKGRS